MSAQIFEKIREQDFALAQSLEGLWLHDDVGQLIDLHVSSALKTLRTENERLKTERDALLEDRDPQAAQRQ